MAASTLNTTTYNNVAANTVNGATLSAALILAWRQDLKSVVNQHASEIDGKITKGNFGLGGNLNSFISDANGLSLNNNSGFYGTNSSTANMPSAVTGDGSIIHLARDSRPSQLFLHYGTNRIFTRGYNGSSWNSWYEIMTDSNFSEDQIFVGSVTSGSITLTKDITQYQYIFIQTGVVGSGTLQTSMWRAFNQLSVQLNDKLYVNTASGKFIGTVASTTSITINTCDDALRSIFGIKWPL